MPPLVPPTVLLGSALLRKTEHQQKASGGEQCTCMLNLRDREIRWSVDPFDFPPTDIEQTLNAESC